MSLLIDNLITKSEIVESGSTTTAAFSTSPNVVLFAFISSNRAGAADAVSAVTTSGLTWVLRANLLKASGSPYGNVEVWTTQSATALSGATVAVTAGTCDLFVTIVAFTGADMTGTNGSAAVGATTTGSGVASLPTLSITTTRPQSWVWGLGVDTSVNTSHTAAAGQTIASSLNDTFDTAWHWCQRQTYPTVTSGSSVTINDTAPSGDNWVMAVVEILPGLGTTQKLPNTSLRPAIFKPGLAR